MAVIDPPDTTPWSAQGRGMSERSNDTGTRAAAANTAACSGVDSSGRLDAPDMSTRTVLRLPDLNRVRVPMSAPSDRRRRSPNVVAGAGSAHHPVGMTPRPATGSTVTNVTTQGDDTLIAGALTLGLPLFNTVVAAQPWHGRHYVAINLAATAGLLGLARARGLSTDELGLSRSSLANGVRAGAGIAALLTAALGAALTTPRSRSLLHDARVAELTLPEVAAHAAIRIPVGTALFEETAYRGVLLAVLARQMPARRAVLVDSAAFGLSHVRPALEANRVNRRGTALREVLATVLGTAVVGVGLSRLRARTGSLVAPVIVHAAANSLATVAAAIAARVPRATSVRAGEPAR
ncbi:MAG TPA: CPBP family intramembrane glutamic endopeptidase [Candidatus Eisenbacteria bacterium]|nr:CPBP family intramembrane glutamic endopeptidase [Candidatus Eisenbacteria bacterium]